MKNIKPDELVEYFIPKYELIKNDPQPNPQAVYDLISIPHKQSIVRSIKVNPIELPIFLGQCLFLLGKSMEATYGRDSSEVSKALISFSALIFNIIISVNAVLLQEIKVLDDTVNTLTHMLNDMASDPLGDFFVNDESFSSEDVSPEELFKNLEFEMPDWNQIKKGDIH